MVGSDALLSSPATPDDLRSTCVKRSLTDQFRAFSAVAETASDLTKAIIGGPRSQDCRSGRGPLKLARRQAGR